MGLFIIDPASFDPNIIYLALVFSLWVGVTAAYVPGTGIIEGAAILGVIGSLFVLAQLPTNWLAVLVLVVGVSSFIVTPFLRHQYAIIAVGGLGLQAAGGLLLFRGSISVSVLVIVLTILIPFAYHQWVLLPMIDNLSRQPSEGKDDLLVGTIGRVTKEINPIGAVNVNSESWTATSDQKIRVGDNVIVVERIGLQLVVEKIKKKNLETEEIA